VAFITGLPPNQEIQKNKEILFSTRENLGEKKEFLKNQSKSGKFWSNYCFILEW